MIDVNNVVIFCYPSHSMNNDEIKEINNELTDLLLKRFNCKVEVRAKNNYMLSMTQDISNDEWFELKQNLIGITKSIISIQRSKVKFCKLVEKFVF